MRVGEIISRVNDAVKIRNFINNVSLDLLVNVMILLFSVCLMFVYSWKLALITLLAAPLFLVIFYSFNKLNRKYQRHIMESSADLEAQLVESLNSISTIKRFGIEEYANLKTETRFVHLLKNTYRSIYGSIMAQGGIQFVSTGITIAILWLGSVLVTTGATRHADGILLAGRIRHIAHRFTDFFQPDHTRRTDCRRPPFPNHGPGTRTERGAEDRTDRGDGRRHQL